MTNQTQPAGGKPVPEQPGNRPRIDSQQILQGAQVVEIEHAGQRYQLRITRENKLILTK